MRLFAQDYSLNAAMELLLQEAARTSPDLVAQIGKWGASVGIHGNNIVRADSLLWVSHAITGYACRPCGQCMLTKVECAFSAGPCQGSSPTSRQIQIVTWQARL